MIKGVHTMFYSSDAEAARTFLRDKLEFPCTDVGDGWLIFDLPEADMGVHPTDEHAEDQAGEHAISFYCEDLAATVEELKSKGVDFSRPIENHGFGLVTYFKLPGVGEVQLYQPFYGKDSQ